MRFKRYLKLFQAFFRFSLQAETEFRANLLFWTIENILWLVLGATSVHLVFGQVDSFAFWTKNQVFLVLFISYLFHDLCWTLIFRNLNSLSRLIRKGELDYWLLKPARPRFLLSFRSLEFDHYLRMALELVLTYRYTRLVTGGFSLLNGLLALFLFGCGFIVFYSLFFAATMTNVWFIKLENLMDLFHRIKDLGGKPTYIFSKGLFLFFSFILPVAYIATFPAQALMGEITWEKVVVAPLLAAGFYWLSQQFFQFALKHYSSASS